MSTATRPIPLWADRSVPARDMPGYLAACRRGLGKAPGTVPAMWPLYRLTADRDDAAPADRTLFDAEHHTLTLWAVHQQGQVTPEGYRSVHSTDRSARVGIGSVVAELHRPGPDGKPPFNDAAIERRFHRMVVAPTLEDLAIHLRGLLTQVRALPVLRRCDYDELLTELAVWHLPDAQLDIRRRWGRQYQQSLHRIRNPKNDDRQGATK